MMREQVCSRLRGTVGDWHLALQSKYGDPRVYALQQQQMKRVESALAHDLSRRNDTLLRDAYAAQRSNNRERHTKRMAKKTKTPGRSYSDTPPEMAQDPPRTLPPPGAQPPVPQLASSPQPVATH